LAFTKWLDENEINFTSHPHYIFYRSNEDKKKRYHPDFYLKDFCTYVEVKSKFTLSKDQSKLDQIRVSNPYLKLLVICEQELREIGIDLRYDSLLKLRNQYQDQEKELLS